MSIGGTLAEARHHAGLTVADVSARTRIREGLIRAIEQDRFDGCGGHFYARGHIRAIAAAVGADPERLIDEYDAAHPDGKPLTLEEVAELAAPPAARRDLETTASSGCLPALPRGHRLRGHQADHPGGRLAARRVRGPGRGAGSPGIRAGAGSPGIRPGARSPGIRRAPLPAARGDAQSAAYGGPGARPGDHGDAGERHRVRSWRPVARR